MQAYKRSIAAVLTFALVALLTGCSCSSNNSASTNSSNSSSNAASTDTEQIANATDNNGDSNTLVVYFSRTGEQYGVGVIDEGNTAIVAKMIAEATGADTFEILPENDTYPTTYSALTDVAKKEQQEKARPAYKGDVPDLSQYDTIFIGAPVWWGDWPMICYTFFENEDLSGKTLYPFSTHAGSGLSGFDKKLSSAVPNATVGEGLAISGADCQKNQDSVKTKVDSWLSSFGY